MTRKFSFKRFGHANEALNIFNATRIFPSREENSNSHVAYLFDPYVKYCSDMKLLFAFEIQDAQSGERKGK